LSQPISHPATGSLTGRLLIAATLVLAAFLGTTGVALDRAFRNNLEAQGRERLQARVYMLLGAAEITPPVRLRMPDELPEPRLAVPGSGSFASVSLASGEIIWNSSSSLGIDVPYPEAGVPSFGELTASDGTRLLALTYPVIWELGDGEEAKLVFQVAEARTMMDRRLAAFRRTLGFWLGGAGLLLLATQVGLLAWSLAPLRRVAREVREIEAGRREEISGGYPRELRLLTENINRLNRGSRAQLRRYRNSLGDLAHSLKTPLAVLRTTAGALPPDKSAAVGEQVERMDKAVRYQLQRGAAGGRRPMAAPADLRAVVRRIIASLEKVYAEREPRFDLEIDDAAVFPGDEGDLSEILGNLADNACKYGNGRVRVAARPGPGGFILEVEDDGPGIARKDRAAVLRRGVRADTASPGHGIGLAVVRDIVEEIYRGTIEIDRSRLGGARVRIRL